MPTTYPDILRLTSYTEDSLRTEIVMGLIVDGLDSDRGSLVMADALAKVPPVGTPHPWRPLCMVRQRRVIPLSTDQCQIEVVYRTPESGGGQQNQVGQWVLEEDISVSSTSTQIDSRGEIIVVRRRSPNKTAGVLDGVTKYTGTINKLLPQRVLRASCVMDRRPPRKAREAVGLVNEREWQGGKKGTWLCTGARAITSDLGRTYQVTVQFLHDPNTFAADVVFVDERGRLAEVPKSEIDKVKKAGYAYAQSDSLRGLTRVTPYGTMDFNQVFKFPNENFSN